MLTVFESIVVRRFVVSLDAALSLDSTLEVARNQKGGPGWIEDRSLLIVLFKRGRHQLFLDMVPQQARAVVEGLILVLELDLLAMLDCVPMVSRMIVPEVVRAVHAVFYFPHVTAISIFWSVSRW